MFSSAVTASFLTGNYTSRLLSWPSYSNKGHALSDWEKDVQNPDLDLSTDSNQASADVLMSKTSQAWISPITWVKWAFAFRWFYELHSWTCVDYTLHFLCGELISPFNSEASSSFPQAGRGRIFNLPVTATKQSWHKVHSWELSEAFCSIPQPSSVFMSGLSCQGDGSVVGTQYLLWLHPLSTEKHWSSFLTLEIVR